jgi:hypothetical protein
MQLSDYIGHEIVIVIPFIDSAKYQRVKLLGVEAGGIWIESQMLLNMALRGIGQSTTPKSLAFFFPYSQVHHAFAPIDGPALNEAAFGV